MWPTTERRYIVARSWTCDPPKHSVTLNSEDRTIGIVDPRQLRRARNHPVRRVEAVRSSRRYYFRIAPRVLFEDIKKMAGFIEEEAASAQLLVDF